MCIRDRDECCGTSDACKHSCRVFCNRYYFLKTYQTPSEEQRVQQCKPNNNHKRCTDSNVGESVRFCPPSAPPPALPPPSAPPSSPPGLCTVALGPGESCPEENDYDTPITCMGAAVLHGIGTLFRYVAMPQFIQDGDIFLSQFPNWPSNVCFYDADENDPDGQHVYYLDRSTTTGTVPDLSLIHI